MLASSPAHLQIVPAQPVRPTDLPVRERLERHLRQHLGVWSPPARHSIVVTPTRDRPGWDGRVRRVQGILSPEGNVLAVSPRFAWLFKAVDPEGLFLDLLASDATLRVSQRLGVPLDVGLASLRWPEQPSPLPEPGMWVPSRDPRLPGWLAPFNGSTLAAFDEHGAFMAGVGVKHHDEWAREIAVGTDPEHRGRGYARMLVAQAARDIIAGGGVPLYRHEAGNAASERVADAAGFPDRGWRSINLDIDMP
ncbi:MAG: GNAT family N-acetyltransferase [Chloroflexia bacterium]|nr:GNAT family N-acetyltransferase [Chloroflexia bacterium]